MGEDLEGNVYKSAEELWRIQLGKDGREKDRWYSKAIDYWEKKDASVDGVLDGFKCLSSVDLRASLDFLDQIAELLNTRGGKGEGVSNVPGDSGGFHEFHRIRWNYVLDCGAGIGRVTKGCLLKRFRRVDIVEPIWKFVQKAKKSLQSESLVVPISKIDAPLRLASKICRNHSSVGSSLPALPPNYPSQSKRHSRPAEADQDYQRIRRVPEFFCSSLQNFKLPKKRYDCIWIQWCALYLTDEDLLHFLGRCREEALVQEGFVCVKENVVSDGSGFVMDTNDNSIMRSDEHYERIFADSGFEVVLRMWQPHFPSSLYPVRLYCLVPRGKDSTFK